MKIFEFTNTSASSESQKINEAIKLCNSTIIAMEAVGPFRKGLKSLKRGMQGWGKDNKPADMSARHQEYDDDTLKDLDKFHGGMGSGEFKGTPRDHQHKLVKRNLRKRGHRDFEKHMGEAEDFEWEPQPEFKGAKGSSQDTSFGIKAASDAKRKQQGLKVNDTWKRLLTTYKKSSHESRKSLLPHLKKMAAKANEMGFDLSPSADSILHRI